MGVCPIANPVSKNAIKFNVGFFQQLRSWAFFTNKKADAHPEESGQDMPTANSILPTFAL
jgi:hypothetical protein